MWRLVGGGRHGINLAHFKWCCNYCDVFLQNPFRPLLSSVVMGEMHCESGVLAKNTTQCPQPGSNWSAWMPQPLGDGSSLFGGDLTWWHSSTCRLLYYLLPRQCSAICMRLHRIWLTYNTCQYQNTPSGWCPPSALYNTGLFQDFAHPNIWFHHPVKKILQISKISIHSERLVQTFIIVGR